jgi:hypothetical protein
VSHAISAGGHYRGDAVQALPVAGTRDRPWREGGRGRRETHETRAQESPLLTLCRWRDEWENGEKSSTSDMEEAPVGVDLLIYLVVDRLLGLVFYS